MLKQELSGVDKRNIDLECRIPVPDSQAILLLREPNIADTEEGREMQRAYTAYIDGYLTASSKLDRFIRELCNSKDEITREQGFTLYNLTEGLRKDYKDVYNVMVEFLNDKDNFVQDTTESELIKF